MNNFDVCAFCLINGEVMKKIYIYQIACLILDIALIILMPTKYNVLMLFFLLFDAVIFKYMNPQRYGHILKMIRVLCLLLTYIVCVTVAANILDVDIRNIESFKVVMILLLPCILGVIICSKTLINIMIKSNKKN